MIQPKCEPHQFNDLTANGAGIADALKMLKRTEMGPWNERLYGPPPGAPKCRIDPSILHACGFKNGRPMTTDEIESYGEASNSTVFEETDDYVFIRDAPGVAPGQTDCQDPVDDDDKAHSQSGCAWDNPDRSMLDDRRGELPNFPTDVLSTQWRNWIERAAHGAGVTPDHVVVPLIGIASSLIGTSRRVQASRSWSEPLAIWVAIVGLSGTGKTPGIDVTKRVLSQIERDRRSRIADLRRGHETRAEAAKAELKKWKNEVKQAVENGSPPPQMPVGAVDPGVFVAPRLHLSNVTIERLAVLLQARPRGMLMIADELAGLFLNMSRYSGGQDNEFWLEAWNGKQFVVERMNRPPVSVDHLLVGITGGLQPDKLVRSFKGDNDGMYARALFAWPNEAAYRPLSNDVAEIEPDIVNALTRIIDLPAEVNGFFVPRNVSLSVEAGSEFAQFRQFLHQGKEEFDGREREWWVKGATHVLRIAGTLAYLDWAFRGGPEPAQVEAEFVRAAVRLVRDYFWPHSRAALRQTGLSDRHANARRALRWMRANKKEQISVQDIRRDALAQGLDEKETLALLGTMVKAGWLREVPIKKGKALAVMRVAGR
jgi:hypothetical protein